MMHRVTFILIALLAITVLVGCGTSPEARFYTIPAGAAVASADSHATIIVAIGAVTIPDMIDRPQIVTRASTNQVTVNEFARWAGPLKSEISRVIAGNLTQMLNGAPVYLYPQSANVKADYRVLLEVQNFDATLGDTARLEVLWCVQSTKDGVQKTGRTVVREATGGDKSYDALVTAYGRALTTVSGDIATAIRSTTPIVPN